ncbi:MAG: copper-binding protein [Rhizobacter sp.]
MTQRMRKKLAITALTWLISMPVLATDMTDGEVRKIDLEQGNVTLRHEEIKDLDMPRMTMVFVVRDKAQLAQLKPGDKVKFRAVNESGKFTVTDIQTVR